MRSLWNQAEADTLTTDLALRAYSSRLIGRDPALVLHGGGNTSVKSDHEDRFGNRHDIIWVKASGYDLALMGEEGFTGLELKPLLRLAGLTELSDAAMVEECLRARIDPVAAAPSIEAIVHALFPFKYVDHSHADAILTMSNSPDGGQKLQEALGGRTVILPYIKPGFDLARQIAVLLGSRSLDECDAVILEHHGVFTFANDARTSYELMIETVDKAERWLADNTRPVFAAALPPQDPLLIARTRAEVSAQAGRAQLSLSAGQITTGQVDGFSDMSRRGTLTPEHVLHNKPFPARIAGDGQGTGPFAAEYRAYVERSGDENLIMLPSHPHWALFDSGHVRSFGPNIKRAQVSSDVARATVRALAHAESLGGWQGLSEADLRDLEYWDLEQAKLKRQPAPPELAGKVALVTGAASGIGAATARALHAKGAVVVGLDINPQVAVEMYAPGLKGIEVDLSDEAAVRQAIEETVRTFGGLDIVVLNAGIFRSGATIETLGDDDWDASLSINLSAHRKVLKAAIPYLRHGIDPSVVIMASRNVTAPGAGAAAYSAAKAGLTQLGRVAALELAGERIRVNMLHPDAVFDTGIWTEEALERSAKRYGLSVEAYKARNLMKIEITSKDVARAVVALAGDTFRASTGAQIPVDGGNERVI